MQIEFLVRPEEPADIEMVFTVNELAFGRQDEARLVDLLRPTHNTLLSLVAVKHPRVIGHCLFTPVEIRRERAVVAHGAALGPVAVHPEFQRKGIGSALIRQGMEELKAMGHAFVVVLGHSGYYPRFGFEISQQYGIRCKWNTPPEVFMVHELTPGALKTASGVVHYAPEFDSV